MRRPTLIVMVKEPRPGRVKTRLGREIGMTNAAWWFRHQTSALLRRLRDPRWDLLLAVAPDREGMTSRVWPADVQRVPQGGGDLGIRMARALGATTGPTLLIGSDIPGITRRHIADGFAALGQGLSVIGPAPDGGFWLIGLRHPRRQPSDLFSGVSWSSPQTLDQTLPTLPGPVSQIAILADVDTADDLLTASTT